MKKAQGTVEYLLIVAVVLIIGALVSLALFGIFETQTKDTLISTCRNAASTCHKNKALYGQSYDCFQSCYANCIDSETKEDVILGKITNCYSPYSDGFDGSGCGYCVAGQFSEIKPR